jgi:hypothetical protein
MSEASTPDHGADNSAGRHRGPASADETNESHQPRGKHRRPSDN